MIDITLADLNSKIDIANARVIAFVDKVNDSTFDYKELKNRYDDGFFSYGISPEKLGDYLSEICLNYSYDQTPEKI
jgi:hypothetical protein